MSATVSYTIALKATQTYLIEATNRTLAGVPGFARCIFNTRCKF